ncbi:MAG: Deacylase [uncultured Campylobacterales bacterium]|uniref:Deacylase n=1 Tax=uncultured Campylobacterales bacterium TaxID=352960 RepID=A0A6S6SQ07_9BACT|nr:MAG: Deacylase [uncultured Campylobacterales bacterium]
MFYDRITKFYTLRFFLKILLLFMFLVSQLWSMNLYKKGDSNENTMFLLSGIHGNERGAYLAACLVVTKYDIQKGSVWVIPNINMPSIIENKRGINGDMNRKFHKISEFDKDYQIVSRLKNFIAQDNINFLLNLHDGSGFYRPTVINSTYAPYRWGQSIVIDQKNMNHEFGNLYEISQNIINNINQNIYNSKHHFRTKNTKTNMGNASMSKSLSWFALNNNKPSITSETSFELDVITRVKHHLMVIEATMNELGIEYSRDFNLDNDEIKEVLYSGLDIVIEDVLLSLDGVKPVIKNVPLVSKTPKYKSSNPLISLREMDNVYNVLYGNEILTSIEPEYRDKSLTNMPVFVNIDNEFREFVHMPSVVNVKSHFSIEDSRYYRINVIGYVNNYEDETNIDIYRSNFIQDYAIDQNRNTYRVEVYDKRDDSFVGMFLIKYEE